MYSSELHQAQHHHNHICIPVNYTRPSTIIISVSARLHLLNGETYSHGVTLLYVTVMGATATATPTMLRVTVVRVPFMHRVAVAFVVTGMVATVELHGTSHTAPTLTYIVKTY